MSRSGSCPSGGGEWSRQLGLGSNSTSSSSPLNEAGDAPSALNSPCFLATLASSCSRQDREVLGHPPQRRVEHTPNLSRCKEQEGSSRKKWGCHLWRGRYRRFRSVQPILLSKRSSPLPSSNFQHKDVRPPLRENQIISMSPHLGKMDGAVDDRMTNGKCEVSSSQQEQRIENDGGGGQNIRDDGGAAANTDNNNKLDPPGPKRVVESGLNVSHWISPVKSIEFTRHTSACEFQKLMRKCGSDEEQAWKIFIPNRQHFDLFAISPWW
jgi:hypothetical protein